jgi:hypothetical protein
MTSDSVMPTGINVDRVAWLAELQRLLAARADADALFRFVDRAMTAAHDQALFDVTVYDADDPTTHPQEGQVVAVLRRYHRGLAWENLSGEIADDDPETGDRWLWVPPEATDG